MSEEKRFELIVKLNSFGGAVCSYDDGVGTSPERQSGKNTNQNGVVEILRNLGFIEDAERMQREPWPGSDLREIVFGLPKTEAVMTAFGFNETGKRL